MVNLWYNSSIFQQRSKIQLSDTFLILEKLIDNRLMEKQVANTKSERVALRRLLDKKLVIRELYPSQTQNRQVYYYIATERGNQEYLRLREKFLKEVKPSFVE